MSATEDLRRLLDERGVKWHDTKIGRGFITVYEHDGITWIVTEHSSGRLSVKGCIKPTQGHYDGMTPEQAVAATLWPGTCKDATIEEHTQAFTCSECGCWVAYDEYWETGIYVQGEGQAVHIHPRYCPNCGRKVEK